MTGQQHEMIDILIDAQDKMREAHNLIMQYVAMSGDKHTEAYIADHLRIMIDSDHGFLTRDSNLGEVIYEIETEEVA